VNQIGSGTVILAASNTVAGDMSISNGTLVVNGSVGNINLVGGALGIGSISTPGKLFVANFLNINSGSVIVTVNKSLVQSNSFITAAQVNYVGGTLVVTNSGPSLKAGDRFVLFGQPVANGNTMPITSTYATFQNDLATDGSITVTTVVQPASPVFKPVLLLNRTNIVISATNNLGPGGSYTLYGTNNLKAPIAIWPVISTGSFDTNGNLFLTNPVNSGANFFILRTP
jgi:autotransporter-associated beta strand protein